MKTIVLSIIAFLFIMTASLYGQADKIKGYWLTDNNESQVYIYKAKDGKYYGKIAWIKDPAGRDKKDVNNPVEKLRDRTILGSVILMQLEYDAKENEWKNGLAYDPKNGKTYDCFVWLDEDNPDILHLKGYVMGMRFAGRTTDWQREASKRTD